MKPKRPRIPSSARMASRPCTDAPEPRIAAASAALALPSRASKLAARRASTAKATKAAAEKRRAEADANEVAVRDFIRERRQKLHALAGCRRASYVTMHCRLPSGEPPTDPLVRRVLRAEELLRPVRKRK